MCRKNELAIYKEVALNIGKSRLSLKRKRVEGNDDDDKSEVRAKEIWKRKRSKGSHFDGSYLKTLKKLSPTTDSCDLNPTIDLTSMETDEQCCYCGYGGLPNNLTDWVQCDVCHQWIHKKCLPAGINTKHDLKCKICEIVETHHLQSQNVVHLDIAPSHILLPKWISR